jgi:hypothetical protein
MKDGVLCAEDGGRGNGYDKAKVKQAYLNKTSLNCASLECTEYFVKSWVQDEMSVKTFRGRL